MVSRASHRFEPSAKDRPPAGQATGSRLVFDRQSIRALDSAAIDEFGIPGIVLMENAARGLAPHALAMLDEARDHGCVLIVCGSGNNGGDGYALARHLHNRGVEVVLAAVREPESPSDTAINRDICRKMRLREVATDALGAFARDVRISLIVDAIFGTGLDGPIRGQAADVIEWINASNKPVLAVDLPSGMDCDTGQPLGTAVTATRTVTLVGWKIGFLGLDAQKLLGEVYVADIGAPIELLARLGRPIPGVPHREAPEHTVSSTTSTGPPGR